MTISEPSVPNHFFPYLRYMRLTDGSSYHENPSIAAFSLKLMVGDLKYDSIIIQGDERYSFENLNNLGQTLSYVLIVCNIMLLLFKSCDQ